MHYKSLQLNISGVPPCGKILLLHMAEVKIGFAFFQIESWETCVREKTTCRSAKNLDAGLIIAISQVTIF